jgi:hypothetical protein
MINDRGVKDEDTGTLHHFYDRRGEQHTMLQHLDWLEGPRANIYRPAESRWDEPLPHNSNPIYGCRVLEVERLVISGVSVGEAIEGAREIRTYNDVIRWW